MPPSFSRLLSLVLATVLSLSVAPPADAAKKKTAKAQTTQTRAKASKAKKTTKPARSAKPAKGSRAAKARPRAVAAPVVLSKAQQLNLLYDQYWDASLKLNPLQATFQGESRYNDQLPNFLSPAFRQQSHDFTVLWLGKAEALGINQAILPIGSAFIELISPLSDAGPVADALRDKGEGLYLISLAVDDLDATLADLREKGVRVNDPPAGSRVTFISPRAANGVLVQLVERKGEGSNA